MDFENTILGETDSLQQFDSRLDNREVAEQLARQSSRQIQILTPDLENPIYDQQNFIRSLSLLASKNRHSKIKILVRDSTHAVKSGHRILELARKFTSSIFIHLISNEYDDVRVAYMTVDDSGYLYKHDGHLYNGTFNFYDKPKVRELNKQFDEIWEHSHPDPECRQLTI